MVYKMIKSHSVAVSEAVCKPRNNVEKKLLTVIDRTRKAIEEAKAILKSMEEPSTGEQPATAESSK